jgi:ribose transport system substrate-binding protein
MTHSRSMLRTGLMLGCLMLATGGTAGGAKAADTLVFSPQSLGIPAFRGLSDGIKHLSEAEGLGYIVSDPAFDATKQAQQLQQLISSGRANAVWTIAVKTMALRPVVDLAVSKKVAMLLNGTPQDYGFETPPPGVSFDNIDYDSFGGQIGTELANCINETLNGTARVAVMQSAEGSAGKEQTDGRMLAMLQAGAPTAEVVASSTVADRAGAQKTVGQILQAHPDLNAIMTTNDETTLGALGAFAAAGKPLPCLVGGGGFREVLAARAAGQIYAVVALDFQASAGQNFARLKEMMANPDIPGVQQYVPMIVDKAQ